MRLKNEHKDLVQIYLTQLYPAEVHPLIAEAREASESLGRSFMSMSANESRIMSTFIKTSAAKKFVEIGTLTGATAIWIAEALQDHSQLWTFEKEPAHAQIAGEIFKQYMEQNSNKRIHLKLGDAVELLPGIEKEGPFDGIFIDGNKAAYGKYLDWAERNVRTGGIIISDNVFLGGAVCGSEENNFSEKQVHVMQEFNRRLADPKKYFSVIVETGEGLSVAIKL